jgi:hypothetical protein
VKAAPPADVTTSSAAGTNTAYVNSRPWAELTIDGASHGTTGWSGQLSVGRHSIKLVTGDGRSRTDSITVRSGNTARYCWDFDMEAQCNR